jgi:hypothetical protein
MKLNPSRDPTGCGSAECVCEGWAYFLSLTLDLSADSPQQGPDVSGKMVLRTDAE